MNYLPQLTKKIIKKILKISVLISVCVCFPFFSFFYLLCGLADVSRNKPADFDTFKRYFTGNGIFTWLLSPFNLFLDLISFRNKGIYQVNDFPQAYQEEISSLLRDVEANKEFIKQAMTSRLAEIERGMLFFKWYGDNLKTSFALPCFHRKYQFIKTIGVSTFNQHKATSTHFGPLRITLRLLYNLSPASEGEIYIQVGGKKHYWKDNPLFIFDDTLQHQSVNYSDQIRHCMFVDIIRPTKVDRIFSLLLRVSKFITSKSKGIFYKKWVFLK
ncbi:aspartyl/asparaginyl beta-hydroxylase domain-containing protein [Legionella fairfieldensis]|uniref:aspartyl/asparaginyl beta-hydroxylase domain-containing protein n=1 Tax=Legionella fairfieldensis TaxID=45064 RepID=UPI00048F20F8|nr:aspartyl/asparaginyl beta-hydroxylase domain-containing protein [Legionella fairfieldensis]